MDAKKIFKEFLTELRQKFPSQTFTFGEDDIPNFEMLVTSRIMKILQKDASMFDEPFTVFGVDISPLMKPDPSWKYLQSCSFAAFLSGDVKTKVTKLLDSVKDIWGDSVPSEVDKILGTEESRSKISEIMEFVMSTKLAKVVTSLVETIDISSFGIDFENPEELMRNMQNPNNKMMETITKKIKDELDKKLKKGEFTKEMLVRDIETIKVKLQEAFGDMFNDMLGARKSDVPSQVILGNSPEARRARMLARLQRKVKERKNV